MQAFAPGIFPRSEALVQATRDLDRKRTTEEAVDAQVASDREELLSVQQEAGLDLITDGMLTWQDLFRPLLDTADGLEPGPLTRFLDTNTFYRAPHATTAAPKLSHALDERFLPDVPGPRVVTLPSPFALSHGTGTTPQVMADAVLKPMLDAVSAELVVLSEPFLGRIAPARVSELAAPLESLADGTKLAQPLDDRFLPDVPGPRVVTLPSPFALSHGTGTTPQVMADEVLKPVLDAVDAELVVLSEPFLGRVGPDRVQELAAPLESLADGAKLAFQLTFCDARPAFESGLADLPVDAIGVDFYLTHLSDVPQGLDKLLLAGVVDARSSAVEDASELAAFAQRIEDEREIEQVALVPNGDLQFVAQPIALEKLGRLGAAKTATVGATA